VLLADTIDPMISCVADKSVDCGMAWSFDSPAASDDCGTVTLLESGTVTNALGGGAFEIVRSWRAVDTCGNSASCSQKVSGMDTNQPTLTCVADKTVECGSSWSFDPPVASDDCGEDILTVLSTVTNNVGFFGETFEVTSTWQAADDAGNTAQCTQKITVADTVAPTLQCAADRTVSSEESWTFDEPIAMDACGFEVTILSTVTNTAGGFVATRTWQAADPCGNTATCSQNITLMDEGLNLTITRNAQNGTLTICWPISATSNVLEFNSSLTNSSSWMAVEESAVESGSNYCVTTDNSGTRRFFRLRQVP
jgi:hypothetical protein